MPSVSVGTLEKNNETGFAVIMNKTIMIFVSELLDIIGGIYG
jgi:hypothetical protein